MTGELMAFILKVWSEAAKKRRVRMSIVNVCGPGGSPHHVFSPLVKIGNAFECVLGDGSHLKLFTELGTYYGLPAPLRQAWFMSGQAGAIAYVIYELFGTNPFDEWANDDRVKYVKANLLGTPKPRKVRVMLWLVDAFAQIKY